mmetsp:Transcript_36125/g.107996  ORF Transcript_36125/g.107996 Transcript_36125/m.107996 type:complete len:372 (-) Transcript_36125:281-1396(-)
MLWLFAHLHDAAGVVCDRAEHVHGEHEDNRGEHAHGCHGGAVEPRVRDAAEGAPPDLVRTQQRHANDASGSRRRAHAHRHARDDVGAVACDTRLGNLLDGRIVEVSVVLGDEDEEEGCAESQQTTGREVEPGRGVLIRAQQQEAQGHDAHACEGHGDLVAALQHLHGVYVLALGRLGHHDADAADDEIQGVDREREEDIASLHARRELLREAPTKDHGRQDLAGDGLEEVGATAGAIANVVAHEICDDRRVARVVLGDVGLHLAHHVGAHVGSLCVDAPAQLCEERHEGCAEAIADEEERQLVQVRRGYQDPHAEEQRDDAQQHHGNDEDAAETAGAEADRHGLLEGPRRGRGDTDVGPHGHPHADVARDA